MIWRALPSEPDTSLRERLASWRAHWAQLRALGVHIADHRDADLRLRGLCLTIKARQAKEDLVRRTNVVPFRRTGRGQ